VFPGQDATHLPIQLEPTADRALPSLFHRAVPLLTPLGLWKEGGKGVRKGICLVMSSHAFQILGRADGADFLY